MKRSLVFVAIALLTCLSANAQSNKTYVSYRGADTNACSRVLPCKTVNHALTVTASGGTVDIIDSGDYDPFVVSQDVTVAGDPGVLATISCPACTAIQVNGGSIVFLKNLHLSGLTVTAPSAGVAINSNTFVFLQNLYIAKFHTGVAFDNGTLHIADSTLEVNGFGLNSSTSGQATFTKTRFINNNQGLFLGSASGTWTFEGCNITGSDPGINNPGPGSRVFLSNSTINFNSFGILGNGTTYTFGNNTFAANTVADVSGGTFTPISTK
jgi:hypothetical protein